MPTLDNLTIDRVEDWACPPYTVYVVKAVNFARHDLITVTTLNQFQASLCDRAKRTQQRVILTWHDVKDGKYLDSVQLQEAS